MNHPEPRIPEEMAPQIFEVAARLLYAEKNQGYSPAELIQAGAEANIPAELIRQAIAQLQSQQIQAKHLQQTYKPTRSKSKFVGIGAAFMLRGILAGTIAELRPAAEKTVNSAQTDLRGVNLSRANLKRANLKGKNLSSANLSKANLKAANLSGVNLQGANLERANLKHANLSNTNLSHANLERANLKHANLSSANLDGANLQGANTEGAIWTDK
jgi:uncharacterized protein YjbI with pentapeptide repeats